jgi:hypothetical protein
LLASILASHGSGLRRLLLAVSNDWAPLTRSRRM